MSTDSALSTKVKNRTSHNIAPDNLDAQKQNLTRYSDPISTSVPVDTLIRHEQFIKKSKFSSLLSQNVLILRSFVLPIDESRS